MEFPRVSVIVPVYKVNKDYFDVCIKSIIGQSLSDIEIILIDDGSPDDSGLLCDNYAKKDKRIMSIHQKNQGVSVARNNGIKHAKAEWIMFVDADDWLELDACFRIYEHIKYNTCDLLMFRSFAEYENKQIVMKHNLRPGHTYCSNNLEERELLYRCAMQPPVISKKPFSVNTFSHSWDKAYRRDFLISNKLCFPAGIKLSEDKVFVLRCFEKLKKFRYVDDILYHYKINADSVTQRYSDTIDQDRINLLSILEKIAKRMDREMGALKNDSGYSAITEDYMRFVFGIISNVLLSKYYHPDCVYDKKTKKKEAIAFLQTDPFRSVVRNINYSQLSFKGKLKKLLLSHGIVTIFCSFHQLYRRFTVPPPQEFF